MAPKTANHELSRQPALTAAAGRGQALGLQAGSHGPNDGDADEQEGPDTWPTSPDKQEEPLDDAPPASASPCHLL